MNDFLYSNAIRKPKEINIYPGITSVSASWDPNPAADIFTVNIQGQNVNLSGTTDKNRVYIPDGLIPNTDYTITVIAQSGVISSLPLTREFRTLPEPVLTVAPDPQPQPEEERDPCLCDIDNDCGGCQGKQFCVDGSCQECVGNICPGGQVCVGGICKQCTTTEECILGYGQNYICDEECVVKPPSKLPLVLGSIGGVLVLILIVVVIIFFLSRPREQSFSTNVM